MEDAVFGVIFNEDLDKDNYVSVAFKSETSNQVLVQNVDKAHLRW